MAPLTSPGTPPASDRMPPIFIRVLVPVTTPITVMAMPTAATAAATVATVVTATAADTAVTAVTTKAMDQAPLICSCSQCVR